MSDCRSLEQILQELLDHAQVKGSLSNTDLTQLQSVLSSVQVGGDLSVGNITQTLLNLIFFIPSSFKSTETPHNLPCSGTMKFVGRTETLEDLQQMLQQSNQVVLAAIEGMGGVGKTELALQYAQLQLLLNRYPGGICWLRARNENIGLQIVRFAETKLDLKPPRDWTLTEQVDFCWSRWGEGDVLVVLDDINDYSKIDSYLPPQPSRFKLLITTRLQLDLAQSLTLDVLNEVAALELLGEWIGADKIERELVDARKLCKRLGHLPLALNLVSRYVRKRKITLAEMIRRIDEKKLQHESLKRDKSDPTWTLNIQRGIAAAFELSWEELSNSARRLGCLFSLFALAPIPWTIVLNIGIEQDTETLEDARVELEILHLLQGEEPYFLHQLIREFLQEKLEQLNDKDNLKQMFASTLADIGEATPEPVQLSLKEIRSLSLAIPHIQEVANHLVSYLNIENLFHPFRGLVFFYQAQGLCSEAETWIRKFLIVAETHFDSAHPHTAAAFNNLALVLENQGHHKQAEISYFKALELATCSIGIESPLAATCIHNLGGFYRRTGHYNESEKYHLQALALRKRLLGEEDIEVAISLKNLAMLYSVQGRYDESESLYLEALKLTQKNAGEKHPLQVSNLGGLADLYHDKGDFYKAEPLYLQALKLGDEVLPEGHPRKLALIGRLAVIYCEQERYEKAEKLYIKVSEISKCNRTDLNISTFVNLGYLFWRQGHYSEAEPLYLQALELDRTLNNNEHPRTATILGNLAALYRTQNKYEEAEAFATKALELRKRLLGEDHLEVAISLYSLAMIHEAQKNYDEAQSRYIQALIILDSMQVSAKVWFDKCRRSFINFLKESIVTRRINSHSFVESPIVQMILTEIEDASDRK